MNTKNKELTIEELATYDFSNELNFNDLNAKEKEKINIELFDILLERIILRTTKDFSEQEKEKIFQKLESDDFQEAFNDIQQKNSNFFAEIGEEFLDFKEEIYNFIN